MIIDRVLLNEWMKLNVTSHKYINTYWTVRNTGNKKKLNINLLGFINQLTKQK